MPLSTHTCNICGAHSWTPAVHADRIRREIRMQREFVYSRLGRKADRSELKDLTDFMHGFPAPLVACRKCGVLTRAERGRRSSADSYEEDPNDPDLMTQVYPRYVEAFRHKRIAYEPLLKPHADVLELGSHLGAFLQTAEEWSWRPVGLDIGKDTSDFVRSHGLSVNRQPVEDATLRAGSFDAVFVWNCFEQLPEPAATLRASRKLLSRNGLLVIRVPNAAFYRTLDRQLEGGGGQDFIMSALAYNNLLGFPYLHGYTAFSLNRLVTRWGFEYVRGFNSELVTMPFADITRRIRQEQIAVSQAVAGWSSATTREAGMLTGPWIELVYRRLEEGLVDGTRSPGKFPCEPLDSRFLERAS
jgi:SAM-dependent methyltransferase